ncbi:putative DNA replication protein [Virus Rctr16k]|nr:putative DNA replication protein [Virus Rctr16k]
MGEPAIETGGDFCLVCRGAAPQGEFICPTCRPSIEARHAAHRPPRKRSGAEPARAATVIATPSLRTCIDCGEPRSGLGTRCDSCQDKHDARRRLEHEAREAERDAELRERRRGSALARIPVTWVDDHALFERSVRSKKLRTVAQRFDPFVNGGAVFTGPTGIGKTACVAYALRRCIRAATSSRDGVLGVRWYDAADLALSRRRHRLGEGDPEVLEEAKRAPLIVIDECGPEPADSVIFEIVNARYLANRPTIITSGARHEELGGRYGQGFVRRIIEPRGVIIDGWEAQGGR